MPIRSNSSFNPSFGSLHECFIPWILLTGVMNSASPLFDTPLCCTPPFLQNPFKSSYFDLIGKIGGTKLLFVDKITWDLKKISIIILKVNATGEWLLCVVNMTGMHTFVWLQAKTFTGNSKIIKYQIFTLLRTQESNNITIITCHITIQ